MTVYYGNEDVCPKFYIDASLIPAIINAGCPDKKYCVEKDAGTARIYNLHLLRNCMEITYAF